MLLWLACAVISWDSVGAGRAGGAPPFALPSSKFSAFLTAAVVLAAVAVLTVLVTPPVTFSDAGRQNERIALAWQPTALPPMAGSAVLSRFTYDDLGCSRSSASRLPFCGVWVFVESRARYDTTQASVSVPVPG